MNALENRRTPVSGPGGMPKGSGSKQNRLHGLMLHAPQPPGVLPLSGLCLQGHIHLSGTNKVSGPISGSQKVGGGGDLERYWSLRRLPSSLWHVRGQISVKRRLERSKPKVESKCMEETWHLCTDECCSLWSECGVLGTEASQEQNQSSCAHESGCHHCRRLSRWTRKPINPSHSALSGRTEAVAAKHGQGRKGFQIIPNNINQSFPFLRRLWVGARWGGLRTSTRLAVSPPSWGLD